jgi:hypothetical protein
MRAQSLPQMALQVRQRVDLGGQNNAFGQNADDNVTDVEMTYYLNASLTELFGILVSKFGDNYYWAADYFLPLASGVYTYPLPQDCLKLINVDYGLNSSGITWRSIRPFNIHQRNQSPGYVGGGQQFLGWANLSYQLQGQNIVFLPNTGSLPGPIRLQYVPEPPLLCATLPTAYATNTTYAQGAQVYVTLTPPNGNPTSQVMTALNAGTGGSIGFYTIGAGATLNTYTARQANLPVTLEIISTFVPGISVNTVVSATGVQIVVLYETATPAQMTAAINGDPNASQYLLVTGTGGGVAQAVNTVITPWNVPGTTQDAGILWTYSCPLSMTATTFDGIGGWEDYIILDTAIKCAVKQEMDVGALMGQRQMMLDRIEAEAANRQAGDPMVVTGGYGSQEDGTGDDYNYGSGWGSW